MIWLMVRNYTKLFKIHENKIGTVKKFILHNPRVARRKDLVYIETEYSFHFSLSKKTIEDQNLARLKY